MVKIKLVSPIQIFSLTVAVITIVLVMVLQKKLPPEVPLLYGSAEGESQLIPTLGLTIPSLFTILVVLVNSALLGLAKDDFTRKVLIFASLIVAIFTTVTTVKIIFLVGSL